MHEQPDDFRAFVALHSWTVCDQKQVTVTSQVTVTCMLPAKATLSLRKKVLHYAERVAPTSITNL